jgi:hypothetical protein
MDGQELLFDTAFVDGIAAHLSLGAAAFVRRELSRLQKSPPPLCGNRLIPIETIPATLDECQAHLRRVLARVRWLRQAAFLQGVLERFARQQAAELEKDNAELRAQNQSLLQHNERLKRRLHRLLGINDRRPKPQQGTTADAPDTGKPGGAKQRPRKRRGAPKGHRGANRPPPDHVDVVKDIPPPAQCPHCQHRGVVPLVGHSISHYIEDIPPIEPLVTEQRFHTGVCPQCGELCHAPACTGPTTRVGPNLTALLAYMRGTLGSSYRKLSRFSGEIAHIALTPSAALGLIERTATALGPFYDAVGSLLPRQTVLHIDETGWRMDGKRWYLWDFSSPQLVYFHADASRARRVVTDHIGEDFQGLVISDFLAVYDRFAHTQKCLGHFLREVCDELAIVPKDKALQRLRLALKACIREGKRLQAMPPDPKRERGMAILNARLDSCAAMHSAHQRTHTLIDRLVKYRHSLLAFIDYPEGEPTNNRAEQDLRPAVIFRKLSFGNRTAAGARNHAVLTTVLENRRRHGGGLMGFIVEVLTAPQRAIPERVRRFLKTLMPAGP